MRRRQTTEETEDESDGWVDRMRGGSAGQTTDDSGGLLDRTRGKSSEPTTNDAGSWFDRAKAEYGLGTLLVAAGAVLFLFPEPITSTAGLVLIGIGALLWLVG
ncbi:hypothetical protein [Natrinema sp. 74]|uniref:hypothetical protein n=1 Tax=Natrinema sp. 74 TaxID=3384159 RepID=UPI0038D3BB2C